MRPLRPLWPLVALLASSLLPLLLPTASAATVLLVEGEARVREAGDDVCGNGGMRVYELPNGTGGHVLYFPANNCWAEWDIVLPREASVWAVAAFPDDCTGDFVLYVDGERFGSSQPLECGESLQWARFSGDGTVAAGRHTLRVVANLTPETTLALDFLQFREAPRPPAAGVLRVEGEDRDHDAAECASDGESMVVVTTPLSRESPSGGEVLWFPHDSCWAAWDFSMDHFAAQVALVVEVGWPRDGQCGRFHLVVDSEPRGSTLFDCRLDGLQPAVVEFHPPLEPGEHTVIVEAEWAPVWSNGAVDYLEFGPSSPSSCVEGVVAEPRDDGRVDVRWPAYPGADLYTAAVWSPTDNSTLEEFELDTNAVSFQGEAGALYRIEVHAFDSLQGPQHFASYCVAEVTAIPFAPTLFGMVAVGVGGPLAYRLLRRRG